MEYIHVFEIITQVFTFIGSQDAETQANECPEVNYRIPAAVMLAQFMNLGMAVMTGRNAVIGPGGLDLLVFDAAIFQALFLETGLQETSAAAAAEVVGFVGGHIHKIFCPHNGFDDKPQIIGNGITVAFADNLTGVLDRELDLPILVPIGVDFEFTLADPLGIVLIDAFYFNFMFDVEFFQSCQD